MKRCPNCGRQTARTKDWACQWCGYPLLGGGWKVVDKTYRELKEEREAAVRSTLREVEEGTYTPEEEIPAPPPVKQAPQPPPRPAARPQPVPEARPSPRPEPAAQPQTAPYAPPASASPPTPEAVSPVTPPTPPPVETIVTPPPSAEASPRPVEAAAPPSPPPSPPPPQMAEAAAPPPPVEAPPVESAVSPPPPPPEPQATSQASLESLFTQSDLTIDELYTALVSFGATADAKFKGRVLRVTGMVYRTVINTDLDLRFVILTSATKFKEWQVTSTCNKDQVQRLRELKVGETVTIQGKYDGYGANVLMRDCTVV